MLANHNRFNFYGADVPYILPPPIPEPPRVINVRPMVPDLSLTSDMSAHLSPKPKAFEYSKYQTIYPKQVPTPPTPPLPLITPFVGRKSPPEEPQTCRALRTNVNFANNLPTKTKLNEFTVRNGVFDKTSAKHANDVKTGVKCLSDDVKRTDFQVRHNANRLSRPVLGPKVVKHTSNPVLTMSTNASNNGKHLPNASTRVVSPIITPSKEDMYALIKHQDKQLQLISEQIEELLRIHKIEEKTVSSDEKSKKCPEKRSVMTMTSMVWDANQNSKPSTRPKTVFTPPTRSTPKTPSTTSKDFRALRLNTISESPSDPSAIDVSINRIDISDNSDRQPAMKSIEVMRNDCDELYYDNMIDNINEMLSNPSNDETDESGRRSSCSPTPPRPQRDAYRRHQFHVQSEQTLYIKKLAAKYLVSDDKPERTKPKYKQKNVVQRDESCDLQVYGLQSRNVSIATKNYLERYGLAYQNCSPPKPPRHPTADQRHHRQHSRQKACQSLKHRILDLEALRKQPTLT